METIKSVASTASGYIYGTNETTQSGTEPVAGQTGKGTVEEPYDKGNEEPKLDATPSKPVDPEVGRPAGTGATDPANGADPASGQKPFQKQQGGDRPMEAPTGEQSEAIKESKDEGEELIKKRDPNDHSGEPMHMHDGSEESVNKKTEDKEHPGQEGGGRQGEDGTGEKWVKTSGLQADGGDFDAAQAGAGREADRLLGEKGIERDERGGMVGKDGAEVSSDHTSPSGAGHSKVKTIDKIKEKLHIGTGKKLA